MNKKSAYIFFAYKTYADCPYSPYFYKIFYNHTKMKVFSARHSKIDSVIYNEYCSTYITIPKEE